MLKRRNKKGQQLPLENAVVIGVLIVLLVVIGYFIYQGYVKGDIILQNLPDNAVIVAGNCEVAAKGGFTDAYCYQMRELEYGSKTAYANCDYIAKNYAVSIPSQGEVICPSDLVKLAAETECKKLKDKEMVVVMLGTTKTERVCWKDGASVNHKTDDWGYSKNHPTGEYCIAKGSTLTECNQLEKEKSTCESQSGCNWLGCVSSSTNTDCTNLAEANCKGTCELKEEVCIPKQGVSCAILTKENCGGTCEWNGCEGTAIACTDRYSRDACGKSTSSPQCEWKDGRASDA